MCTSLDCLSARASLLGDHAVLHSKTNNALSKCPVKYDTIDAKKLIQELARCEPPVLGGDDVSAHNISALLYECARESKKSEAACTPT